MKTEELRGKKLNCPLCKEKVEIRLDEKHQKPYLICNPCGVQLFIRREDGINRLKNKIENGWLGEFFE